MNLPDSPPVVRGVDGRSDLRRFIDLPSVLYGNHAPWVPPLHHDERRFYDRRRNTAFDRHEVMLALAWKGRVPVGRIMGIVNLPGASSGGTSPVARFSSFACVDDRACADALLSHAESWARQRGAQELVGPMGFSDQDPEGFIVEGFEFEPTLASYWNPPYLVELLASAGYVKKVDYVVYRLPVVPALPPRLEAVFQRILSSARYRLVEPASKKELRGYARQILHLVNETFDGLYGFTKLTEEEITDLQRRFFPLVDPRFVKIATVDEKVVAFLLGVPNINEGLRRANGRLLPLGWLTIMRSMRRTRQLDLLLGAVAEPFRGQGLEILGMGSLMRSATEAGMAIIDSHHELESNSLVRAVMERAGGRVYKRYRIFRKGLA